MTRKLKTSVYLDPSFMVNQGPLGLGNPSSGIVNTMSSLFGDLTVKSSIFTTGSGVSAFHFLVNCVLI